VGAGAETGVAAGVTGFEITDDAGAGVAAAICVVGVGVVVGAGVATVGMVLLTTEGEITLDVFTTGVELFIATLEGCMLEGTMVFDLVVGSPVSADVLRSRAAVLSNRARTRVPMSPAPLLGDTDDGIS